MNGNGHTRTRTSVTDEFTNSSTSISHSTIPQPAGQFTEACDVPSEFRKAFETAAGIHGPLQVAFFLPAMVRPGKSGTVVIPQRIACVFTNSLVLLSATTESAPVVIYGVDRSRVLGYRIRGFLLDCWITLYHAGTPREIEIQFPVQSGDLFAAFVKVLFHSGGSDASKIQESATHSVVPMHCPARFSRFLHAHPELGETHDCFLQTAVPFGKTRRQKCEQLLLARTANGLIALADEEPPDTSWLGLRMTYLRLRSVLHAEWRDQFHMQQGALFLHTGSNEQPVRLEWSLAMRFREAALAWIEGLNSALTKRVPEAQPGLIRRE